MSLSDRPDATQESAERQDGGVFAAAEAEVRRAAWRLTGWSLFIAGLFISYGLFVFFPLAVPFEVIIMAILLFRRSRLALWYATFSPYLVIPLLCFLFGIGTWLGGCAELQGVGLPAPGYGNLDPELRVGHASTGCCAFPFLIFTIEPNNAGIHVMHRIAGYPPGAYRGQYPTQKQAALALAAGAALTTVGGLEQGVALPDGTNVKLDEATLKHAGGPYYRGGFDWRNAATPCAVSIYKQQCILLAYRNYDYATDAPWDIFLIDRQRSQSFAIYETAWAGPGIPPAQAIPNKPYGVPEF